MKIHAFTCEKIRRSMSWKWRCAHACNPRDHRKTSPPLTQPKLDWKRQSGGKMFELCSYSPVSRGKRRSPNKIKISVFVWKFTGENSQMWTTVPFYKTLQISLCSHWIPGVKFFAKSRPSWDLNELFHAKRHLVVPILRTPFAVAIKTSGACVVSNPNSV